MNYAADVYRPGDYLPRNPKSDVGFGNRWLDFADCRKGIFRIGDLNELGPDRADRESCRWRLLLTSGKERGKDKAQNCQTKAGTA